MPRKYQRYVNLIFILTQRGDGPIALVLAPTRELAMQIDTQCRKFCQPCKIQSLAIYGGVPKDSQRMQLRAGVEILIATPGRLLDFMEVGVVKLNKVTFLVLDEADRMLVSKIFPLCNLLTLLCNRIWDLKSTSRKFSVM